MDLTAADIAQNKAIKELAAKAEHLEDQLVVALAMLDKVQASLDALSPLIAAVESVESLVDRVEQAVKRLESL